MKQIELDKISRASTVQIRTRLNQDAVERYMADFEKLPAIDVFVVKGHEGFILADGFHRVEAAERLGLNVIKANIIEGTLNEAMEFAVKANVTHGQPLSRGEREDAILRLKRLHPAWTQKQIAKFLGVSEASVSYATTASTVRREVTGKVDKIPMGDLRTIHALPKKMWAPILEAREKRKWKSDTVRLAVNNIKDPSVPEKLKTDLLEGKTDPVVMNKDGEMAFPIDAIKLRVRTSSREDSAVAFLRVEETLTKIERFSHKTIIAELDAEQVQRLVDELPGHIAYLEKLLAEAKTSRKPKEVTA